MSEHKSSYTEKDKKKIAAYLRKHPTVETWGTIDGLKIPFHMLKTDHLINIVRWIHDNPKSYSEDTRIKMENLLAERQKDGIAGIIYDHT